VTERLQLTTVLVPVDGSECSRYAAEHAARIAAGYGAEIVFLHAVDDVTLAALSRHGTDADQALLRDRLFQRGQAYVRDAVRLTAGRARARGRVVDGDPCAKVCEEAASSGADLIVMGKSGRRGARGILMGSVTRRVIESTDVPVLVVTHPPRRTGSEARDTAE